MALAAPLPAGAQAVPVQEVAISTGSGTRFWSAGLRLDHRWDSNPLFGLTEPAPGAATDAAADRIESLGADLTHTRAWRRGRLSFHADGSGVLYGRRSEWNSMHYSGGLSGWQQLSPRATLSWREAVTSTSTARAARLAEAGLQLPLSNARIHGGGAGLVVRASSATTVRFDLSHESASFDSAGLANGWTYAGTASAERRLGVHDALSLSYSHHRSRTLGHTGAGHTLHATWRGVLSRSWSATLAGGASRFVVPGEGTFSALTGGASLAVRLRRGSLSGSYGRSMGQAFGLGRERVADQLSLHYATTLGRWWGASASVGWSFSHDPRDPAFRYSTASCDAGLQRSVGRRLSVSTGYAFRRSDIGGAALAVSGHSAYASLGWRWDGRAARGEEPAAEAGAP